jgi:yecA family protein
MAKVATKAPKPSAALSRTLRSCSLVEVPSPADLARSLTDDDWIALTVALDEPGEHNMDVAVGLLTAVVTAPTPIQPSTWLPLALGDYELTAPDDPVLGLMLRAYNTIFSMLRAVEVMCPHAHEVAEIEHFCTGYMMGVELDNAWTQDFDAMNPVLPIAVLAGIRPLNHPDDEDHVDDEDAWMQEARQCLPLLILEAFTVTAARRRLAVAGSHARSGTKIGRNDPCACGSGKKYKKCCGR